MTHILDDGAGQYLTSDNGILCGQKTRRSAITRAAFVAYMNAGTLRKDKMCKPCMQKVAATYSKNKDRDTEE